MPLKLDSKQFKTLAKGDKLVPHLDNALGEGDFAWSFNYTPKGVDDAWHPSGDCTPSPRKLYLQATGKGDSIPHLRAFIVGHFFHAYIQHVLVEKMAFADWGDIEKSHEVRWADGPYNWARGTADVAPCRIPSHGDYLVDIKTMNSHDFNTPHPPKWLADKWECQLAIYMDWHKLDRALILGVQKDSPHAMKEFEYEANPPLVKAIMDKWKAVGQCVADEFEPSADETWDLPLKGPIR